MCIMLSLQLIYESKIKFFLKNSLNKTFALTGPEARKSPISACAHSHYSEQVHDGEVGNTGKRSSVYAREAWNWRHDGGDGRQRAEVYTLSLPGRVSQMVFNSLELLQTALHHLSPPQPAAQPWDRPGSGQQWRLKMRKGPRLD